MTRNLKSMRHLFVFVHAVASLRLHGSPVRFERSPVPRRRIASEPSMWIVKIDPHTWSEGPGMIVVAPNTIIVTQNMLDRPGIIGSAPFEPMHKYLPDIDISAGLVLRLKGGSGRKIALVPCDRRRPLDDLHIFCPPSPTLNIGDLARLSFVLWITVPPTGRTDGRLHELSETQQQRRDLLVTYPLGGLGMIGSLGDTGLDRNHCFFYDPVNAVSDVDMSLTTSITVPETNHSKIRGYVTVCEYGQTGCLRTDRIDVDGGHGTKVAGVSVGASCGPNQGIAPDARVVMFDLALNGSNISLPSSLYNMLQVCSNSRIKSSN